MKSKYVRLAIVASLVIVSSVGIVRAEENVPSAHGGQHPRLEKMKTELGLSDEQAEKVKDIFQQNRGKCQSVTDEDEQQLCRFKNRQAMKKELKGILSESQLTKLEEMKNQRREERREERGVARQKFCDKGRQ